MEFVTVRELYELAASQSLAQLDSLEYVELSGWVRTNRDSGKIGFIEFNDGTYFKSTQLVYDKTLENFDEVSHYNTGVAITVSGKLVLTPQAKQPFEILLKEVILEGEVDDDYPLQKKRHSFAYLREIAHLRPRTNTFNAVFRVRSVLSMAVHEFFQSQGFVYLHSPILTTSDGEGTGQTFTVTTRADDKYDQDYFGKHAFLTGTGQLHAEAFIMAFRDVYTFGPTFRAEKSNTSRHASEFWMIEPEIAFADLGDCLDLIEDMVKYLIKYVLVNCEVEMEFFDQFIQKGLIERLNKVVESDFRIITYTEAIDILLESGKDFEFPVSWGVDLSSEHERYICEEVINGPVFVKDYPRDIKPYYMRGNEDGKTVAGADLLVPGVGEIVGGSQREERADVLKARLEEEGVEAETVDWYLDLRRYGGVKHAGYGLGFERFLMYITGVNNIRDVIPFPRTVRNLDF
ncbi:MAG TPA: asparagine--tRNA ligase [Erysipelotrichaceae bacterium]|nr:asparagine--tRNA ligase [Erysipelotrichaceae bacterium]